MTIVKFQVNSGQEKKVSSKIVLTQPISVQTDHRLHIQYAQARHGIRKVLFFFLAVLHGMWGLSSPTRDQTHALYIASAEPGKTKILVFSIT